MSHLRVIVCEPVFSSNWGNLGCYPTAAPGGNFPEVELGDDTIAQARLQLAARTAPLSRAAADDPRGRVANIGFFGIFSCLYLREQQRTMPAAEICRIMRRQSV